MSIELSLTARHRLLYLGLLLLLGLGGLGLLGRAVTQVEGGTPRLLSPDRWRAAELARTARTETEHLHKDADRLLVLLDAPQPDPVAAMLLAQGIYARQRTGTSATAPARQALIAAAEAAARYASGTVSEADLVSAVEAALHRLELLLTPPASQESSVPTVVERLGLGQRVEVWVLYLPLLLREGART
jgi:hypothetical protein